MILTLKKLEAGKRITGGYSFEQIRVLGDDQSRRGWKRRILGKEISEQSYETFLELKKYVGNTIKNSKRENISLDDQYKDQRWLKVRDIILKRDNFKCARCGKSDTVLNVHHIEYIGKYVWDTPYDKLITLCISCHRKEHNRDEYGRKLTGIEIREDLFTKDAIRLFSEHNGINWKIFYRGWTEAVNFLYENKHLSK